MAFGPFNTGGGGAATAAKVRYNNQASGLDAQNTQAAIDELAEDVGALKPLLLNADPTAETKGEAGQHAINTVDKTEWTCYGRDGSAYIWNQGSGGSSAVSLAAIRIKTAPAKTAYKAGETFDPTGMVVTADYAIGGLVIIEDRVVSGYAYPTGPLAAGTTSVTISYTEDGETKTATQAITCTKTAVTIPKYSESRTYNGNTQTPNFDHENAAYMTKSGEYTGQNAGSYTALFDLNDTSLYEWADGSTAQKSVSWSIAKATPSVTAPTAKSGLVYNGSAQALVSAGSTTGGTLQYSLDGTSWSAEVPTGTDAGSYTVRYRVVGGTNYTDVAAKSVSVSIAQHNTTLTLDQSSVTLDADHLTATVDITTDGDGALSASSGDPDTVGVALSGKRITVSHVNYASGTVTVTVDQASTKNYKAASATFTVTAAFFTATLNVTAVAGASVTATSGGNSYSGTANSSGIASIAIGQSGTYSVTGSYQDAASNSQNVSVTQDGGTYSATLSWITLALTAPNGSSVTLTNGSKTFTGTGTGAAQTYYLPATGTWTATATMDSKSTSKEISATTYTAYTLTLAFVSNTLNDNDWDTIADVSSAATGDTYWDVGDCHEITLNGKIGAKMTLNNKTMYLFIVHFNLPDNKNTADNNIIWSGFKSALTGGKDIVLCDDNYADKTNWASYTDGTKCFTFNHWGNVNYGGWKGSDLRYDILGAVETQPSDYGKQHTTSCVGYDATVAAFNSPKADTLMAALPADFRAALGLWNRWIDAKGNKSNVDANIQKTVDAGISLPTEFEVQGTRTYANNYEQNHQTQFAYYANGNSKVRYCDYDTTKAAYWWCSSAYYNDTDHFCRVNSDGSANDNDANRSLALAPAFKTKRRAA